MPKISAWWLAVTGLVIVGAFLWLTWAALAPAPRALPPIALEAPASGCPAGADLVVEPMEAVVVLSGDPAIAIWQVRSSRNGDSWKIRWKQSSTAAKNRNHLPDERWDWFRDRYEQQSLWRRAGAKRLTWPWRKWTFDYDVIFRRQGCDQVVRDPRIYIRN